MSNESLDLLKSQVITTVREKVESENVRFDKRRCRFLINVDGLGFGYQIVFVERPKLLKAHASLGVRFDAVERIFHRTSGIPEANWNDSTTIGQDMRTLHGQFDDSYEFEISDDTTAQRAALRLIQDFEGEGQDFFSKYSTLPSVDAALNDNPMQKTTLRVLSWYRCSTGIIVAKLVGNSRYSKLVEIYSETLRRESNGFYLPRFEELVADLENVSQVEPD